MHRLLATVIFAYAGLTAYHWGHVARKLSASPGILWCGNVVSDPYMLLINVAGPMAAVCAVILARRCLKTRRWPPHAITALLTFAITSAWLFYEARILKDYGIDLGRIWWRPWR